jgi:hypothetical protein
VVAIGGQAVSVLFGVITRCNMLAFYPQITQQRAGRSTDRSEPSSPIRSLTKDEIPGSTLSETSCSLSNAK